MYIIVHYFEYILISILLILVKVHFYSWITFNILQLKYYQEFREVTM